MGARSGRVGARALSCGSIALCALVLAACGSGSDSTQASGAGNEAGVGAPLTHADCSDWNKADPGQRLATIADLADFAGGPVGNRPGGHGSVLDDKDAYKVLQGDCKATFARGFKLYKLYTRAASFQSLAP